MAMPEQMVQPPHPYASLVVKPKHKSKRAVLLKGPSGSGKTYQFRTLMDGGWRGLYVNIAEHYETISDLDMDVFPIKLVDIPLSPSEESPTTSDFIKLFSWIKSGQHDYDFIFVDSLMRLAEELVSFLEHQKKLSGYELWGAFGKKMRELLKRLVGLTDVSLPKPVHVIGTWGVEVAQDWEGKRAIVPVVDGKMVGPRIDYYFDDVLMLRREPDGNGGFGHFAYAGGTNEFDAKVSSGIQKLPTKIANPNLYRIVRAIQGNPVPPSK